MGGIYQNNTRINCQQLRQLGPLLFNIFINDIFMIIEQSDIWNFADDNTTPVYLS